jgi:glycerol-3-phosphate O-acyltransferase/dihydroxyacetone phosphate acyltransferase
VLLQFGPPIEVGRERLEALAADPRKAAQDLTTEIEQGLRAMTVNAQDWEVLRVLDGVRRLYQPPGISLPQRIELARRFNSVYPTVMHEPEAVALYERVHAYLERLRELELTDRDLRRTIGPFEATARLLRHLVLMLVFLPLALPGAVIHLPVGLFMGWGGLAFAPRKDVIATTKFVLGLLSMVLAFFVVVGVIGWRFGAPWALGAAVLLPLSGYATLRVFERGAALRRLLRTLRRLLLLKEEMAALRAERQALQALVIAAVDRYRPADMTPLFPEIGSKPPGS